MRLGLTTSVAALAGILGAGATHTEDPLVLAFCFVFWGAAAGAIAWLISGCRFSRVVDNPSDGVAPLHEDRRTDDFGYEPFGLTDVENTPRPGAHGLGEETIRWLKR